jgi:hypothetical protein
MLLRHPASNRPRPAGANAQVVESEQSRSLSRHERDDVAQTAKDAAV